MRHPSLFFAVALFAATPAFPCSLMKPPPAARELVDRAEIIVRARADHEVENRSPDDPRPTSPPRVVFTSVQCSRNLLPTRIPGHLNRRMTQTNRRFRDFRRPGEDLGNCYALSYHRTPISPVPEWNQSKPGTDATGRHSAATSSSCDTIDGCVG